MVCSKMKINGWKTMYLYLSVPIYCVFLLPEIWKHGGLSARKHNDKHLDQTLKPQVFPPRYDLIDSCILIY